MYKRLRHQYLIFWKGDVWRKDSQNRKKKRDKPLAIQIGALVDPKFGNIDDVSRKYLCQQSDHQIQRRKSDNDKDGFSRWSKLKDPKAVNAFVFCNARAATRRCFITHGYRQCDRHSKQCLVLLQIRVSTSSGFALTLTQRLTFLWVDLLLSERVRVS